MKSHRVGAVALLVSSIFCSSLSAQTDQPVSLQVSGLALNSDRPSGKSWEWGWEGQVRWTGGAWSFGAGVQYMSTFIQEEPFGGGPGGPGPDGVFGTSDDELLLTDNDTSTLGLFLTVE